MLDVRNRLGSFCLGPSEKLYTDHQGHRVVFASDQPVVIAVTGTGHDGFQIHRLDSGGALNADGASRGLAVYGPSCPVSGPDWAACSGSVKGCGWIAAGSMVASADREVLGFTTPIDLPFWEGGEVDGRVHVHASEAQWTQILHVPCIGDRPGFEAVSESSPYEFNGQTYRHHLGAAQFTVPIASTDGLVLTKHYDRLQGRQRARVWVDGEFAGVWDAYAENPDDRSSHARFPIDPALTNGKAEVRIAIDPPAGSPLWNWSSYSVEALRFIV